jgi:hypothetical protein
MWLYGYANPVLYTDPTGRYSVEQLYGLLFTGAGNSDFQTTVRTAVRLVGHAFSRATATSRNGYYSAMVSWSIFKKVYGIRQDRLMEFEWHPQTNSNPPVGREEELGCYNCRPAACITANLWVDVPLENQAACDCETTKTCYCLPKGGYTHNERYIEFASLWPNYQGADQNLRRVNNVIHELGHAFNARIGRAAQVAVRDKSVYVEGQLWQLNSRPRGFYGNGSNTWQQNTTPYPDDPNTRSSEVFADMFVGWVYNRWAEDAYGIARADFMIAHMHDWIKQAMNKP